MDKIINYLNGKYEPDAIIVYGSYADGTNNLGSDFDALLITNYAQQSRDVSVVDGIQLDVFLYSPDTDFRCENLLQLYDCRIILDKYGKATQLCADVKNYIDSFPRKSREEIEVNQTWCEKMLVRTQREDAEGYFRWHWVLCDSLEFYCDIRQRFYFGPKKALKWMQREEPEAYAIYSKALASLDRENLERWVKYMRSQIEG